MALLKRFTNSSQAAPRRAFSLTEMLISVAVLGVLVTLAVPAYFSSQINKDKEQCRDQMVTLARAEELYRIRNRAYTTTLSSLDLAGAFYELPAATSSSSNSSALRVKCPVDTVNRDFSYTVTLFTDTDGSPGFTIREACGLHTAGKAHQLTSNRNGLSSDSSGIKIDEVNCQ